MYSQTGLAEIVRDPSPITLHYFNRWFSGAGSYGMAFERLGWPVNKVDIPLLTWSQEKGLLFDLQAEETVLYQKTILGYSKNGQEHSLTVDWRKVLSLSRWLGTLRSLWSQTTLLVNCQHTYDWTRHIVASMPINPSSDLPAIESTLLTKVWPSVIMVDYIGEFVFATLTHTLSQQEKLSLLGRVRIRTRTIDWYTQSMLAWSDYQDNNISKTKLLREYGYCAADPYELTSPRYYELLESKKPRLNIPALSTMKVNALEDLYVGLQYLRSEAKRRSLIWVDALRGQVAG